MPIAILPLYCVTYAIRINNTYRKQVDEEPKIKDLEGNTLDCFYEVASTGK